MSETGNRSVFGTHGEFVIDKDGLPIGDVPQEYKHIKKVNLKEFEEWSSKVKGRNDWDVDILTVGYWYDDDSGVEKYSPAEDDYRKLCENGWPIVMDPDTAKNLGLEK